MIFRMIQVLNKLFIFIINNCYEYEINALDLIVTRSVELSRCESLEECRNVFEGIVKAAKLKSRNLATTKSIPKHGPLFKWG